jgi:hypothetical protein
MKWNKIYKLLLIFFSVVLVFSSCDEDETYSDRRKREKKQVEAFLKNGTTVYDADHSQILLHVPGDINVISEEEFHANDSMTNVEKNEYVLFRKTGVYMQIVRKGPGKKLQDGESTTILNRFTEFNIAADSISCTNKILPYETMEDKMTVVNTGGTFTASYLSGVMSSIYQSASVPIGWLVPLTYINIGRQDAPDQEVALVRLIVPSTQGQSDANNNVYACFYEISYQRGR